MYMQGPSLFLRSGMMTVLEYSTNVFSRFLENFHVLICSDFGHLWMHEFRGRKDYIVWFFYGYHTFFTFSAPHFAEILTITLLRLHWNVDSSIIMIYSKVLKDLEFYFFMLLEQIKAFFMGT